MFLRSRKLNFYHFGSMATKNGSESNRFKESEMNAAETFVYKWGFDPFRTKENSHSPKGNIIKGIRYE
jgi:hypothetical protein